ncbi:MAG: GNAT family N-acetyltransferase [Actinomycetota bacterium]
MNVPAGARVVDDPGELHAYFSDLPAAHIYAIADLEEPFWSESAWYRRGDAVVGVVALPEDDLAVYAVSTRDPTGCLELVADLLPTLPPGQLITGPIGLGAVVRAQREVAWSGRHVRYRLTSLATVDTGAVEPLGPGHVDELLDLYDTEPGAAFFLAHMLRDETFVGVRDGGRLIAAAGTHVLAPSRGVAAIGSVYTHPDHRGRGLAKATTAAAVARVGDRAAVIGLNVAAENGPARRAYESLGFVPVLEYDEAQIADPSAPPDPPGGVTAV